MKIAILSDFHDRDEAFDMSRRAKEMGAEVLLFCGDFCGPFMLVKLAESFSGPIHIVFGNNDGDQFRMLQNAQKYTHVTLHGEHAAFVLDGKRIGMTHYPFYADAMAKSGDYDLVAFGHDHEPRITPYGSCLAVNPGSAIGKPTILPSFALYDTALHRAELLSYEHV